MKFNSDEKPKRGQLWMLRQEYAEFPCMGLFLALGKGKNTGTARVEIRRVVERIPLGRLFHRAQ